MLEFQAEILQPEKYPNAAYVLVPGDVKGVFGSLKPKVKIYFDTHLYRGSISNMGYGSMVIIPKEIRNIIGKSHGDKIQVLIELDTEERLVEVPEALLRALENHNLMDAFNVLSYTNKKELARSVKEAKRKETQIRRLEKAINFVIQKSKN